jgi:sugar-specific transcriptional regulator TrmB
MFESNLIEFGLSQREAKVYLASFSLGEAPASVIAEHLGFSRLTVYSILKRLLSMGLILSCERKSGRVFCPASPETFLNFFDDQLSIIQSKRDRWTDFFPKLKRFFKGGNTDFLESVYVRTIQDEKRLKDFILSTLSDSFDWLVVHDGKLWDLILDISSNVSVQPRVIIPESKRRSIPDSLKSIVVKTVPDSSLTTPIDIMIIGSHIFFFYVEEEALSAFEVKHVTVARHMRSFFILLSSTNFFNV